MEIENRCQEEVHSRVRCIELTTAKLNEVFKGLGFEIYISPDSEVTRFKFKNVVRPSYRVEY